MPGDLRFAQLDGGEEGVEVAAFGGCVYGLRVGVQVHGALLRGYVRRGAGHCRTKRAAFNADGGVWGDCATGGIALVYPQRAPYAQSRGAVPAEHIWV